MQTKSIAWSFDVFRCFFYIKKARLKGDAEEELTPYPNSVCAVSETALCCPLLAEITAHTKSEADRLQLH